MWHQLCTPFADFSLPCAHPPPEHHPPTPTPPPAHRSQPPQHSPSIALGSQPGAEYPPTPATPQCHFLLPRECSSSELDQPPVLFWAQPHTCSSPASYVPPQLPPHSLAQDPVCWTLFTGATADVGCSLPVPWLQAPTQHLPFSSTPLPLPGHSSPPLLSLEVP